MRVASNFVHYMPSPYVSAVCPFHGCNKTSSCALDAARHMVTHMSKEEAPDDFGCPFHGCNKTSRTAQLAAQHMVTHMSYEEAPRAPPRKRAKRKK